MDRATFLVILCLLCCSALVTCSGISADMIQLECLAVPASEFAGTLKSTIDTVRKVTSVVSKFTNFINDFCLSNAINVCLGLLDLSSYNLERTLAASQAPLVRSNNTAKLSSDLRTWLSDAPANKETCLEGLEGTNGMLKNMVGENLNQVSSLVLDILRMVRPVPVSKSGGGGGGHIGGPNLIGRDEFLAWLITKDQKLLQATGFQPNAVHHSHQERCLRRICGNWQNKNKLNVMLIGDGIDATMITGNRNNTATGWSTYSSATFGVKGDGFLA